MSRTIRKYYFTPDPVVCRVIDGVVHEYQHWSGSWMVPTWYGIEQILNCKSGAEYVMLHTNLHERDGYASTRGKSSKYRNRMDNRNYRHDQNRRMRLIVGYDPEVVDIKSYREHEEYFNFI